MVVGMQAARWAAVHHAVRMLRLHLQLERHRPNRIPQDLSTLIGPSHEQAHWGSE